jgi:Signal transduction histidine kinase
MKKTILIILTLFSVINAIAQTGNVDSLINILETNKLSPKEQLDLYLNISNEYFAAFNSEKNILFAQKGLGLAEKEKNKFMISRFNEYIGFGYSDKASNDTAMVYFEKALAAAIDAKNDEQTASINISIAMLYANQGKYNSALEYYLEVLPIAEKLESNQKNMIILFNIGAIHSILYNYDRAIYYLEQVIAMAEKSEDFRLYYKRNTFYELGKIYKDRNEFDLALKYAQESLEISRSMKHKVYEAMNLQLLAQIYSGKEPKDYDLALQYAEESARISEESGYKAIIIASWNILSNIYREEELFEESEKFAYKVWEIDSLSLETVSNQVTTNILYNLSFSNIFLGNSKKAAYFLKKHHAAMVQYSDKSLHNSLADMEIKYETEKKDLQIFSLKKERKLYIWLGVAGLLFAAVLGCVLWQTVRSARREKQLIATRSVLDGEMGERARLAKDLHDRLSGNLSAVKIGLSDNREALQTVCDKLDYCIEEVRRVAHNLMPSSLQFGLKIALEDFVAQFPNIKVHFFGKEERLEERVEFIVYCCANELITNAVRHSGAENINVQLVQNEKYISFSIQDDGCGFDEKSVVKGLGLKSIYDRVASCGGRIDIVSSPGKGSETTIELKTQNI